MSITETCTVTAQTMEDRLAPKLATSPTPFRQGRALLRSRSFDVLRQFPAYLCSRGSSQDILDWLYNSRTKLSSYFSYLQKEAHKVLLIISVWSCLLLLSLQMFWCLSVVTYSATTMPLGMLFMFTCIIIMGTLAAILGFNTPKRPPLWKRL